MSAQQPSTIPSNPTQPQKSLEEFLAQNQNEIILGCNNSQQRSLASFNRVVQQLQTVLQLLQLKEDEIKRLEKLCEKNKIDHKPAPKTDKK